MLTYTRWYWQLDRGEISNNGYVFLNGNKKPITPNSLYRMMLRLGKRSEIHLHPHRFRHTFAINFIRNQGNIYVLQKILGHTSLDMVKRYLKLAESDVTEAHRKASPLKHLKFDPLADYKAV